MKTNYYFDYKFTFADNRALVHKLRGFLDGAISAALKKHGYPAGNFCVSVSMGDVLQLGDRCLVRGDAFFVCVYDRKAPDEIVVDIRVSLVSDKIPCVSVCGKPAYSVDFENETDIFDFAVSYERVALSDAEIKERVEKAFRLFINSFPLPCKVNARDFPRVTFKIKFLELCDPPDADSVLSLVGFGGALVSSPDPYCVVINVDFGDEHPFILHDAVARLKPLEQKITHILIT